MRPSHRRSQDSRSLFGVEFAQLFERLGRDADTRRCEQRSEKQAYRERIAERVCESRSGNERNHNTSGSRDERSYAHLAHLLRIGFHTGDEHQEDDTDRRE